MFSHALLRRPGPDFAQGLTTARLGPPDYDTILLQHRTYRNALQAAGLNVHELEPLPGFPDAYFVEDTAVVTPETAVITRPGALARRGEEESIAEALARFRPLSRIEAPGTLDGGDVLQAGRVFFIGISSRTNEDGARQLAAIMARFGYESRLIPVGEGLHLKSGVNLVDGAVLLITGQLTGHPAFRDFRQILVPPGEEYAANCLRVNHRLLMPAGFPATRRELESGGLFVEELPVSEVQKMDGGLTCMSLRF